MTPVLPKIIKTTICLAVLTVPFAQQHTNVIATASVTASQDNVAIPDDALRAYLNGRLGQASDATITEAQMDSFTTISLQNLAVTDLTGLEYAHNVTRFSCTAPKFTNFDVLTKLTKLDYLSISGSQVTSEMIPDLSPLTNLNSLDLSRSKLTNEIIPKINNLPNLESINLSYNNKITDIMALQALPKLNDLNIQFCGVADYHGIENFSVLKYLTATGQNVGYGVPINTTIKSSALRYDEEAQTLYVPFSLMTGRTVNFDDFVPNFTTSTADTDTNLVLNEKTVAGDRMTITTDGLTVSGVTKADFENLDKMTYNARVDMPVGSYAAPSHMVANNYKISAPMYKHSFAIEHSLTITADDAIKYIQNEPLTEEQFLQDIGAVTDDGTAVSSDFADVVDFGAPGVYVVTLNAENSVGLKATPVQVEVTILQKPVITATDKISYAKDASKTETEFLADIAAATTDGSAITSDFADTVDFTTPGDYTVTLHAESADGVKAEAVQIVVTVEAAEEPVDPVDPVDPIDPIDPVDPVDPVNPVNPVDPIDPVDPVNPVNPVNPVDPVDPMNPVDPVDPINPTNPVIPVDSVPTFDDVIIGSGSDPMFVIPAGMNVTDPVAQQNATSSKTQLPKTGDSLPFENIILGGLFIGASFLFLRRKKLMQR
ncbi:LapB repeat-containing protein [Listeria booriae]|uniref:LapB repeat-containing protein n=1 Tax=Listeria booriae TaxID=1552123 RepID=A0A7X0TM48_9LIST|nr:LapB repeat-containing protein [Listeria booriae]MBC1331736.1 LapB repeat-containing protein [Listeria booriae]MBC2387513.1 LapB repeat-containing protein [Listeria booriae]